MRPAAGQPRFEVWARSPTEFFLKAADIRITAVRDAARTVTELVPYQNGGDRAARKVR